MTPLEADTPLVVHTDAVLTCSIAVELFKTVAWGHSKVLKRIGGVEDEQLSQ